MYIYRIRIEELHISTDNMIIKYKDENYVSEIKKGSIDFKIVNEDNREIPLSYINVGDKIKIYNNKI